MATASVRMDSVALIGDGVALAKRTVQVTMMPRSPFQRNQPTLL